MSEASKKREAPAPEISPEEKPGISRREFLIGSAAALATALFSGESGAASKIIEKALAPKKEIKGVPKIKFNVFFGFHGTAEDIKDLEEEVRNADIFVAELMGWDVKYAAGIGDLASGKRTPEEVIKERGWDTEKAKKSFFGKIFEIVHKNKKPSILIEPPAGHELTERVLKAFSEFRTVKINFHDDLPAILNLYKSKAKAFAHVQVERESYILDTLYRLKRNLEDGEFDPKLRGKKEIKIAMFFGAQHTGIYQGIRGWGENISMKFPKTPFVPSYMSEMLAGYFSGEEVGDELASRALMENAITPLLYQNVDEAPQDSYSEAIFRKGIVVRFTSEEIKWCFKSARESSEPVAAFYSAIGGKLAEKGIKIPESNAELEAMVRAAQ